MAEGALYARGDWGTIARLPLLGRLAVMMQGTRDAGP